jgi:DNA-directed RNA polymerase alpha subunit
MSEIEPTPELPDDTPIREVGFPTRTKNALSAAGLKTVGEVREMSDEALLSLPNFGMASVAHLRETLGGHTDDRDHLFRSIATSVARVLTAPLDDGGDVSLLMAGQAR